MLMMFRYSNDDLILGFAGVFSVIASTCLLAVVAILLHSSSALQWEISQRMVVPVPDWSSVGRALDVGCGRGVLLNSVTMQLKQGIRGCIVGLDPSRSTTVSALRYAESEGVHDYVTCREGDAMGLPFVDAYFDVVVSTVHLSRLGKAPEERGRGLGEMVRVLKTDGVAVVWDLNCMPEFAARLREMRMEDIRISERIFAYLVGSHILSFRKLLSKQEHFLCLQKR